MLTRFLKEMYSEYMQVNVIDLSEQQVKALGHDFSSIQGMQTLILDVDSMEAPVWMAAVKEIHKSDNAPYTILLVDRQLNSTKTVHALESLGKTSKKFAAFVRPLNIMAFRDTIERQLD